MKHIKLLSLLLVAVMTVTMLCACGDESDKNSTTEPSTKTEDNTPQTPASTIATKEDMDKLIGSLLSDASYSETETAYTNYNRYTYKLASATGDYSFDYKVKLSDGTEFIMPVSVKDIEGFGWSTTTPKDTTFDANSAPASPYKFTKSNNEIGFYIRNNNDTEATFENCDVAGIEVNQYNFAYSPSYHIIKDEKSIDFTVCNNITNNSTVEDVINSLGAPTRIYLDVHSDNGGYCDVKLVYAQNSNEKQQMIFLFSGNENRILQFNYLAG